VRGGDDAGGESTHAPDARVLQQHAEDAGAAAGSRRSGVADDHLDAPSGSARVRTTAMVCGWQSATKKAFGPDFARRGGTASWPRRRRCLVEQRGVGESSMPVRSVTMVWKFSSASRRPCEISGW
jgi:hypothetical protein